MSPAGAIGLEIDPGHQLAIEQEREHVVAVDPFRFGDVDLDPIDEMPQPLHPLPKPDQVVERREQGPAGHLAWEGGVRM